MSQHKEAGVCLQSQAAGGVSVRRDHTHTLTCTRVWTGSIWAHTTPRSALVWGETNHFWVKTQDCSRFFSTVTDETKNYWDNPASAASPAELAPGASCNKTTSEQGCPDRIRSRVNATGVLRLTSLLWESHPARDAPTFPGRKNDSFPTQLLLSPHRLLWNVSLQTLPSAGPSFSSIELQTLVDANEVEEPLCWELWKWRDTNENRWFLRSTSTCSMCLPDTCPREASAFPM